MGQAGGDPNFAVKPVGADGGGDFGAEDLYRHLRAALEITRQVHHGHAATPELALEGVAMEGGFEELRWQDEHGPTCARDGPNVRLREVSRQRLAARRTRHLVTRSV